MKKEARPITAVDRMLAWADEFERAVDEPKKARRRSHRRFGQLDIVVIEQTDEPTIVFLTNDEGVIVEAKAAELFEAAGFVEELLRNPPPVRKKRA